MTSWSWFALSRKVGGLTHFCVHCYLGLDYILIFPSLTFASLRLLVSWGYVGISLHPDKLADIWQLALSLLQSQYVTVHQVMSFLAKANFCTKGHSRLQCLCHVIQSDMLPVYHSPTHLFSQVHFSFSLLCQLEWLAHLQQSPVPLQFPLPDVDIATHWAIYFQGSGLPLSVSGPWSGSMCRAHIALQELQAVAMMLCQMAFHLSGKVVALHLDNSTAKAYLSNESGTVSPFLSRLASQILNLTNKHGITLIPAYIPADLNMEANYLSQSDAPRVASSLLGGFSPLGPSRGGPDGIFSFHSVPALLHLGISTISGGLGVECLQPSLDVSGKLHVSSSCISSSGSVQVSGRTCQR